MKQTAIVIDVRDIELPPLIAPNGARLRQCRAVITPSALSADGYSVNAISFTSAPGNAAEDSAREP